MRLVSLCPSLTELVFALGRGSELVGRTAWCRHPEGRVEPVERVGGTKTPDLRRLVALRPDLVLMNDEENRREDWEALRAAGRPAVRFAYLIWHEPWMGVGADTHASALLSSPGGTNVLADAGAVRYPAVDPAALAALGLDLVLLGSEPFPFAERHADELAALTGLPRERIRLADGELLSWHGSRTPAGLDYAERLIRAG